ncbi:MULTISPECIES: hypothetical protein [unclassified Streptomyces]|uniref:hypothetical protein n=1 Tax=unclassified Streptomyces TaxID=2593676 RepID=UPI0032D57196
MERTTGGIASCLTHHFVIDFGEPVRFSEMREVLVAGLLAGYGIAMAVGAIAALLVGLTARTSLRVGAAAALGVATADGLYAMAAALGGSGAASLVEPVAVPLRWTAAIVLIALAVRTGITVVRQH